jgi:putative hemolysin
MKYIDIEKSVKESKSKTVARLPGFIIKSLINILRQDELNRILNKYIDCEGVSFHKKIIEEFNLTLDIKGIENLPENGRCFFASNHPFGVIDGLVLTKIVGEKYGDFRAIGNDAFMFVPNLRPFIATVNVYGRSSKESIAALQKIYDSDIPITHFPAGEVSRFYWGKVQDCKWQKSFITKAVGSKRDIVPFYFQGRNSLLFHTISILRRMLFIKANLELILLSREMFEKKNSTIKVWIGKPVSYKKFDKSLSNYDWAQFMRKHVYSLGKK